MGLSVRVIGEVFTARLAPTPDRAIHSHLFPLHQASHCQDTQSVGWGVGWRVFTLYAKSQRVVMITQVAVSVADYVHILTR